MRDKVILGVTLSIVLLLTLVIYGVVDTQRGSNTTEVEREHRTREGKHHYAQYCIQCHGPLGEGCIGPALNRAAWRPLEGGAPNPDYDEGSLDLIRKTIERGRNSNQPGMQMPQWSVRENGPLNDQQIEELVTFIQYGEWGQVLEEAPSASNLNEPVPSYPGFDDPDRLVQVKDLMLEKGCLNCHLMGKGGGVVAADLSDVGSRRPADWLREWIKDPKAMPLPTRGPNIWLVGPTATVPAPEGAPPIANLTPEPTAQIFPMNATYMPTIPLTDEELDLLVEYLSSARIKR
ncbi:MAG TPA: cytochrome c [Chloroflexia bacterium]|nr:cytochrome c [Chloroflexia bacterium]